MIDRLKGRIKVSVATTDGNYYYRGRLIDDGQDYLIIDDIKAGKIFLNKKRIVSVQEWGIGR